VERQATDCRALADQLKYTVVRVITDNDVSAYKGKRRGYTELLEALDAGEADAVLSWHNDRLHRQPKELEPFIELVERRRIEVHFVQSGPIDLATPSGRLSARIAGAVAMHESEHKAARLTRQRKQAALAGRWSGGPRPFGFEADGVTVRPVEAELIRRGYDIILSGGSLWSVNTLLNEAGVRTTRDGLRWELITTKAVLLRPRNAGLSVHQGKVVGKGEWEPIVSEDELNAVTDILTRPGRATTLSNTPRWLGSLLYVCGVCGETMHVGGAGRPGEPRARYRCRGTRYGGRSHLVRAAATLDAYVVERLFTYLDDPARSAAFTVETLPPVDTVGLRSRLAALEVSGQAMARRLGQELVSESEFEAFAMENRAKIKEVERELATATLKSPTSQLVNSGDARATWETYRLDERRAVLREAALVTVLPVPRGPGFNPDGVRIEWL
jgi:DNA invertase Pin-like site-specific DNA recombinase